MALIQYRIPEAKQKQAEEDHYYIDGRPRSVASIKDDETAKRVIDAGCSLFEVVPQTKPTFNAIEASGEPAGATTADESSLATEAAEEVKTTKSKTK